MTALKWNLCTSFAAIGVAIAYVILFALFGLRWQLLVVAIAGLVTAYVVSTAFGALAKSKQLGRSAFGGVAAGVGFAWGTLLATALVISLAVFTLEATRAVLAAPSGQPVFNVLAEITPGHGRDFIGKPLIFGLAFGILPAGILGVIYGAMLRVRFDSALAETPAERKWATGASAATLVLALLLGVAAIILLGVPGSPPTIFSQPAEMPIALRECGEQKVATGVTAYCRGSPCENGECDWKVEVEAFLVHVRPPIGSAWQWAGGGIGTGSQRDVVVHNIYWVQFDADGLLNEASPRRHARYEMVFEGGFINIGAQRFRFEPGMQLDVQFLEDWSVTASAGVSPD